MIPEEKIEAALLFLRKSAEEAAQARANCLYLAEWIKTVRANVKLAQTGVSNAAAEDIALASQEYSQALEAYKEAVREDALFRFKRQSAEALIDAWRTEQASLRTEGKAYA